MRINCQRFVEALDKCNPTMIIRLDADFGLPVAGIIVNKEQNEVILCSKEDLDLPDYNVEYTAGALIEALFEKANKDMVIKLHDKFGPYLKIMVSQKGKAWLQGEARPHIVEGRPS